MVYGCRTADRAFKKTGEAIGIGSMSGDALMIWYRKKGRGTLTAEEKEAFNKISNLLKSARDGGLSLRQPLVVSDDAHSKDLFSFEYVIGALRNIIDDERSKSQSLIERNMEDAFGSGDVSLDAIVERINSLIAVSDQYSNGQVQTLPEKKEPLFSFLSTLENIAVHKTADCLKELEDCV
jgi:hypothetical protein